MLADKLRDRGIAVAQPASKTALIDLKSHAPSEIFNALYESIYQWFDGFADSDFDEESFVRIWPISRLVKSPHLINGFFPFADFSLDTEVYGLVAERVPEILCLNSGRPASVKMDKLIESLINGNFDNALGI